MGASGQQYRKSKWGELQVNSISIIKSGQLLKRSKYLKQWRSRTIILTKGHLLSFSPDTIPTTVVSIFDISNLVKLQEEGYFLIGIDTRQGESVSLKTKDQHDRDHWFSSLKQEKIRMMKESHISARQNLDDGENVHFFQMKEQLL